MLIIFFFCIFSTVYKAVVSPALGRMFILYAVSSSVTEPPLFWAAPEVQGPGADSGSNQIGSALAPGKKRRLQAAPAPCTKIFYFELLINELVMQVVFRSHLPL